MQRKSQRLTTKACKFHCIFVSMHLYYRLTHCSTLGDDHIDRSEAADCSIAQDQIASINRTVPSNYENNSTALARSSRHKHTFASKLANFVHAIFLMWSIALAIILVFFLDWFIVSSICYDCFQAYINILIGKFVFSFNSIQNLLS
jgi:hypothetical protein